MPSAVSFPGIRAASRPKHRFPRMCRLSRWRSPRARFPRVDESVTDGYCSRDTLILPGWRPVARSRAGDLDLDAVEVGEVDAIPLSAGLQPGRLQFLFGLTG